MYNWNSIVKRILKAELVRRDVSHSDLVRLLANIGVEETKSGIDSKISRGSFSASFFMQCLTAIGCDKIEIGNYLSNMSLAAKPKESYKTKKSVNQ